MKITFYQVQGKTPAEEDAALPILLNKMVEKGHKVLIHCPTVERMERLNQTLWQYDAGSFLPHATLGDGTPELQPILLVHELVNPNEADCLLVLNKPTDFAGFKALLPLDYKMSFLFNSEENCTKTARQTWKKLKDDGTELAYFAQTDKGWQKKG